MKVFSLFLKLLKSNAIFLILYIGIFTLIISMSFNQNEDASTVSFEPDVLVINNDTENSVTDNLIAYIDLHSKRCDSVKGDQKEALFYGDIVAILTIPEGFGSSFTSAEPKNIEVECGNRADGYQFMNLLNGFISTSHLYYTEGIVSGDDFMSDALALYVSSESEITVTSSGDSGRLVAATFNLTAYVFLAALSSVVALIMVSLKPMDIRRRLDISCQTNTKRNGMLIIANIGLGIAVFALVMGLSVFLLRGNTIKNLPLLLINNFLMMMVSVSFGYLMSVIMKSKLAISGLITVVSLGLAFITGVFVEQKYLDKTVNNIGKIFPTHWTIKLNDYLSMGSHTNSEIAKESSLAFGIQIIFIALFFGLSVFFSHRNRTKEA